MSIIHYAEYTECSKHITPVHIVLQPFVSQLVEETEQAITRQIQGKD